MKTNEIPSIMTRKECQEILKISKNSMLELINQGYIVAFKIKGSYRITRDSLYEFINNSTAYMQ